MDPTVSDTSPPSERRCRVTKCVVVYLGWQHPFVNVFRHFCVDRCKDAKTSDVKCVMDKTIGKRVWQLQSSVAVATFIQLPITRSATLGLVGRFCYLQVLLYKGKEFLIHLDVQDLNNNVHRVTLSNIYRRRSKKRNVRSLQVPLCLEDDAYGVWLTLAVDMSASLKTCSQTPFKCLRGVQICANLAVRSVFTSDIAYRPEAFPKEMVLSMVRDPAEFPTIWIPEPPTEEAQKNERGEAACDRSNRRWTHSDRTGGADQTSHQELPCSRLTGSESIAKADRKAEETPCEPLLDLCFVNGFSGEYTNLLLWVPNSDEVLFAAGALIVAMKGNKEQRFFIGHSAPVCCLSLNDEGSLLASGQEGCDAVIRLWHVSTGACLSILCCHDSGLISLDLSSDGDRLVGVGLDEQKRQVLTVWDLTQSASSARRMTEISLQSISLANVKCVKWSPYDTDRLLSCGRDNVRMHRIRDGKLRSMPIHPMEQTGLQTKQTPMIFTCLAFSCNLPSQKWIFAGSSSGFIFQIDYDKYCCVASYRLQPMAINCMAVSEGFCVIGSDDGFLRVWPLDFADYLLEAENESPVTSVGLSADGLQICAGTESGTISLLDIVSHTHETLLRSHTDTVHCLAVLPSYDFSPESIRFLTGSKDGTMRQWTLAHPEMHLKQDIPERDVFAPYFERGSSEKSEIRTLAHLACCQSYEFRCPDDEILSIAITYDGKHIAAGFQSCWIRIFDLDQATISQEFQQSGGAVVCLAFTHDTQKLIVTSREGMLVVYDSSNGYRPIKQLFLSTSGRASAFALDHCSRSFVAPTMTNSTTVSLLILCTDTLQLKSEIRTDARSCNQIVTAENCKQIWLLDATSSSVTVLETSSGAVLLHLRDSCLSGVSSLCLDEKRELFITGDRAGIIRFWSWPLAGGLQEIQKFCGHPSEVTDLKISGDFLFSTGKGDGVFIWKFRNAALVPFPQDDAVDACLDGQEQGTPSSAPDSSTAESTERKSEEPPIRVERLVSGVSLDTNPPFLWHHSTRYVVYAMDSHVVVEFPDAKERHTLTHHSSPIGALCFSQDGSLLATASSGVEISGDVDICLWQTQTRHLAALLRHHKTKIRALAFSVDSVWLVSMSGEESCYVVVWDVASQTPVAVSHTDFACRDLYFLNTSLEPQFIAVGQHQLLLWELQTGGLHRTAVPVVEKGVAEISCGCLDGAAHFYCVTSLGHLLMLQRGSLQRMKWSTAESRVTAVYVSGRHFLFGTETGRLIYCQSTAEEDADVEEFCSVELPSGIRCIQMDPVCESGMVSTADAVVWGISLRDRHKLKLQRHEEDLCITTLNYCICHSNETLKYCEIADLATSVVRQLRLPCGSTRTNANAFPLSRSREVAPRD